MRIHHPRPTLAAAALVLTCALAACGSTRYVVVQPSAPAGAAPASATPSTTGGPTDAATEAAVADAVEGALGLDDRPFEARTSHLTADASDLGGTYAAVLELVSTLQASIRVDAVSAAGDTATATVTVVVDGADYASGVPVALVRDSGTWKVTREGACAALAVGSPCPS